MQSTEFAAFYAALRSSAQNRVTVLPPAALVALAPIGTGYIRTTDGSWWMKLADGNVLTKIAPEAGGGSADFPSPFVIWVSGTAPAVGDGKIGTPFQTVQEGLTAAAAQPVATVIVAPGTYAETPTLTAPAGRHVTLCAFGRVTLNGLAFNNSGDTTFWVGGIADDDSETPASVGANGFVIDGDITIAETAPALPASVFGGSFALAGDIIWVGASSPLTLTLMNATIGGTCNIDVATLIAEKTTFDGLVTVDNIFRAVACDFAAGCTVTVGGSFGLFCCNFIGTFTGLAGSGRMDGSTYKSLRDNGGGFSAANVLYLLEEGLAEQTQFTPGTPTDWVPLLPVPTSDVKTALDQLAQRLTNLPLNFPNPLVIWVSASAPVVGDGSFGLPFQTIQEGVDAVADGDHAVLMIGPGNYMEPTVTIDGTGRGILLYGIGPFSVANGINYTVTAIGGTSPGLFIFGPGSGEGENLEPALSTRPCIFGNITLNSPASVYFDFGGSFFVSGNINGAGCPAVFASWLRDCRIGGAFNCPTAAVILADDVSFGGVLTADAYYRLTNCHLNGGMVVATAGGPSDIRPIGLFGCSFGAGTTFSGGAPARMDGSTYKLLLDAPASITGPSALYLVDYSEASQATYTPTYPLTDWLPNPPAPPALVNEALDTLGFRAPLVLTNAERNALTTTPPFPRLRQTVIDTDDDRIYSWNGASWVQL